MRTVGKPNVTVQLGICNIAYLSIDVPRLQFCHLYSRIVHND